MMRRRLSSVAAASPLTVVCLTCLAAFCQTGCDDVSKAIPKGKPAADPPEFKKAIALKAEIESEAQNLLLVLQRTRTAADFESNVPSIKRHFDTVLSKGNEIEDIMSTLELKQRRELNRRLVSGSSLEATMKTVSSEIKRVCEIKGVAPNVAMDFLHYAIALEQRSSALSARSRANQSGVGSARSPHRPGKPAEPIDGPNSVRITCHGPTNLNFLTIFDKIREFNSGAMRATNGVVQLGNVQDFDALVAALKERVGTVQNVNRPERTITVLVDTTKIPPDPDLPAGTGPGFPTADMPSGFGSGPGGLGSTPDKSASNPFEPGNAAPKSSASNPFEPGNAAPDKSASNPFKPENAAPDKSASNPFEPGNAAPDKSASNPFKPDNAPSGARSGAPGGFGSGPSGGFGSGRPPGLGGLSGRMGMGGRMGPHVDLETQDPDELVEIAKGGDRWRRRAALRNLAAADPSKASKETKKAVCLALKAIAFEGQADEETRALAVEGMGLWAGRYAAPQLLQLLKHSGDGFFHRELHGTILRVLGELKHPDTLEPLVLGFADGSFNSDATAECLIQFGPEVEPLVLKHCRPGNTEHSRRVVYILYKIGTARSLPALRALSNGHEGFFLREEIAQATEAIKKRRKTQAKE